MPAKYGRSPWIDTTPASRVPSYPRHRGSMTTDVVVIGAGLTGAATAYAFAAAGIKVVLIDAGQVGRGSSGLSAGWVSPDPGPSFLDIERARGLKAARHVLHGWRRAALDYGALVRRLNLKCQWTPSTAVLAAMTLESAGRMKREQQARRKAGVDAPLATRASLTSDTQLPALSALRLRDAASIDPYRACLGLVAAAVERGATVLERSTVSRVRFRPKHVDIDAAGGTLRADRVVITTGVPTRLYKPLIRHVWLKSHYLTLTDRIPARVRDALPKAGILLRDSADPSHGVRWVGEDRLLVSGADGDQVAPKLRDKTIVQRTGQLMYELSTIYPEVSGIQPAYGWEAPYARTVDGLPYIGPHRNFPRHLFGFVDVTRSVTGAYLASRILLRHYLGEPEAADEVFGFARAL